MLAGAASHDWAYPFLTKYIEKIRNFGKITVPQVLGINHWLIILAFLAVVVYFFRLFEKKQL
jgi:hypothetical protein